MSLTPRYPRRWKRIKQWGEPVDYAEVTEPGGDLYLVHPYGKRVYSCLNEAAFSQEGDHLKLWVETFDHHELPATPCEPKPYDWQAACLESQEREKEVRAELVNARLELKSYRATEKAFYERLRAAGLPEGGLLIDTINVFAELGKLRERCAELEGVMRPLSGVLFDAVMMLGMTEHKETQAACRDARLRVDRALAGDRLPSQHEAAGEVKP